MSLESEIADLKRKQQWLNQVMQYHVVGHYHCPSCGFSLERHEVYTDGVWEFTCHACCLDWWKFAFTVEALKRGRHAPKKAEPQAETPAAFERAIQSHAEAEAQR